MNAFFLRWLQIQVALSVVVCLAVVVLIVRLHGLQELYARSELDLAKAKGIADRIEEFRKVVPSRHSQESALESVVPRIRSGLQEARIEENQVGEIRIIGRSSIPKTNFFREDTAVGLKGIQLMELFAFIRLQETQWGTLCSGMDIRTAGIAADSEEGEKWDVDVTLTQVIEQVTEKLK